MPAGARRAVRFNKGDANATHMSGRDLTSLARGGEACVAVSIGPAKGGVYALP
jgi:hypothetical protein